MGCVAPTLNSSMQVQKQRMRVHAKQRPPDGVAGDVGQGGVPGAAAGLGVAGAASLGVAGAAGLGVAGAAGGPKLPAKAPQQSSSNTLF